MTALLEWAGLFAGVWIIARGLRRLKFGMMIVGAIVCGGFAAALAHAGLIPLDQHVGLFVGAFLTVAWHGLVHAPRLAPRSTPLSAVLLPPVAPAIDVGRIRYDGGPEWSTTLPKGSDLLLRYRDADGQVTDRRVRPNTLRGRAEPSASNVRAIGAYCLMRKGPRVFRLDRIIHVADPETGELVDLVKWLSERMR